MILRSYESVVDLFEKKTKRKYNNKSKYRQVSILRSFCDKARGNIFFSNRNQKIERSVVSGV